MVVGGPAPVPEAALGQRSELASGGMARIYAVPGLELDEEPGQQWVYKKYKAKARPVSLFGLTSLVKLRDALEVQQRRALDRSCNWPVRVVVDDEGAAGMILRLIPDEYFARLTLSSGTVKRKAAEIQYLFQPKSYCDRVGIPFASPGERRALVRSLCYAMGLLDRADVVYGDVSARNVIYRLSPRPSVMLLDCDAVRPHGGAPALGSQPHSPDWEPPEARLALRRREPAGYGIQNKATDRYKLGLAVLRILTPGPGCATRTDPAAARSELPPSLFTLLERSLGDDPGDRPHARTWYQEMTR